MFNKDKLPCLIGMINMLIQLKEDIDIKINFTNLSQINDCRYIHNYCNWGVDIVEFNLKNGEHFRLFIEDIKYIIIHISGE